MDSLVSPNTDFKNISPGPLVSPNCKNNFQNYQFQTTY